MSKRHEHDYLIVHMFGEPLGELFFDEKGQLTFRYNNENDSRILSVSMDDCSMQYSGTQVEKWFFGVLPDEENVRRSMCKDKNYGHNSVFGLLSDYGAELPGAIQVFTPDGLQRMKEDAEYRQISKSEIAERIENLISNSKRHLNISWHDKNEHWSLAGGQPKFALMRRGNEYYECFGDAASNVIVKPGVLDMDSQSSVEHLTMKIAKETGLSVADSAIVDFEGISAIVIDRYDRKTDEQGNIIRLHQEDFCQALGLLPIQKYMEGKNPTFIAGKMIQQHCDSRSMAAFIDSIMFNYLVGGTDGHLKNHSLLHMGDGRITMAPLYDVASQFPYMRQDRISHLALGIGTEKRIGRVGKKALSDMARLLGVPPHKVFDRFEVLAELIPKNAYHVLSQSENIPNIDEIASAMLPRVEMNCEYAAKNLNTTHFLVPNLFGASNGFSLSDGDKAADLQEEMTQQGDDLLMRDPLTGAAAMIPARDVTSDEGEKKKRKHSKTTQGTSRPYGEGRVYVSPHVRGGVKVSGYWRASPHKK